MGGRGREAAPGFSFGQRSRGPAEVPGFGRAGALIGLLGLLLVAGGFAWAAVGASVPPAEHPRLFGGSLVLEDQRPLTVIDLATGHVTIRLQGVYSQVGAAGYGDVEAVALGDGTLLVDRTTGTFNLLAKDDYLLDTAGPGVGLGPLAGSTGAGAFPSGDSAYIVRYAPRSTVSLVDASTVRQAARLESRSEDAAPTAGQAVAPLGFVQLGGPISDAPGSAAVNGATGDMWVLVRATNHCDLVQLHPAANAHNGLVATQRASFPKSCAHMAVAAAGNAIGVASPGRLRVFGTTIAGSRDLALPGTSTVSQWVPVSGSTEGFRLLARSSSGWLLAGTTGSSGPAFRAITLGQIDESAVPASPVMSGGSIFTLDQAAPGQPALWQIDARTGAVARVDGEPYYPARGPTEKASFAGAQVLAAGPRVVFNNPGSLLAVVVFTDGSRPPLVVDKSEAVTVSATGPADVSLTPPVTMAGPPGSGSPAAKAVPAVQPVSQQVTCATTKQKPYAPQINAVTPSSGSALISWTYQLLDQTDCEPDSWSVKVTALSTTHQPDDPVQAVNGQNQLLFTGLRPATTYEATVTAYINGQSTSSSPATFTTAARGPDAPTSVTTTSDGKGDWVVSWAPCTASDCYVPADVWNVTGSACGNSYVGQPPAVQVPGSQTSVTIDADSFGLLGDSLSFSVQGSLASGLTGNPASDGSCTQAWRPPDPSAISLDRSSVQQGQTVSVTLQVATSTPAVEAFGSRSTEFVYSVGGSTIGPTSSTTATVRGLAPGVPYTPSVVVYPAGHQDAAITVAGPPITPTLQWPPNISITVQPSVDQSDMNQGNLAVTFANLPPGQMQSSGSYTCGSTEGPSFEGLLTSGVIQVPMNLVDLGGQCTITATVSDQDPAPYGGTSSAPVSAGFSIGTQPRYTFSTQIDPACQQSVCVPEKIDVAYTGSAPIDRGGDWVIETASSGRSQPSADPCATQVQLASPNFPVTVNLPDLCLDPRKVDVTVSYKYLGTVNQVDAGTPTGSPAPPPTTTTTTPSTPSSTASPSGTTVASTAPAWIAPIVMPLAGLARRRVKRKEVEEEGDAKVTRR